MGEFEALTVAQKKYGVIAHHVAATHGRKAEAAAWAWTGVALPGVNSLSVEISLRTGGCGAAEHQGRATGRINLVAVVGFNNLDVEV